VEKCTDPYLLDQLKAIKILDFSSASTLLISLTSLDLFIKSYSRRLSLFTRLYDTIHRLQWGNAPAGTTAVGAGAGSGAGAVSFKKGGATKGKRTLTSADKKYVAALQKWQCAWCGDMLPARYHWSAEDGSWKVEGCSGGGVSGGEKLIPFSDLK
jgi:hypothetical protein